MNLVNRNMDRSIIFMIGSRYTSYLLNFLRGVLMASILGPFNFGVWGAITLSLQYLAFSSIGIEHSITVILSSEKDLSTENEQIYFSTALIFIILIGFALYFALFLFNSIEQVQLEKFPILKYSELIIGLAIFLNLQQVFINVYRVKNRIRKIALYELVSAIFLLLVVMVNDKSQNLIGIAIFSMTISSLVSIFWYGINSPIKIVAAFNYYHAIKLINLGFPLFIYNLSFFLILGSGRTILSIFYSIEQLGYYSLANSIAVAILLGVKTIGWSIFPKVLSDFKTETDQSTLRKSILSVDRKYSTSVFLIAFFINFFIPILFIFLPEYYSAKSTITLLLFAQAFLAAPFVFNIFTISRNYQTKVAYLSILTVLLVVMFSIISIILHLDYIFIALSVLGGSISFAFFQTQLGKKILYLDKTNNSSQNDIFSFWNIMSYIIVIMGVFSIYSYFFNGVAFIVFVIANYRATKEICSFIYRKFQPYIIK